MACARHRRDSRQPPAPPRGALPHLPAPTAPPALARRVRRRVGASRERAFDGATQRRATRTGPAPGDARRHALPRAHLSGRAARRAAARVAASRDVRQRARRARAGGDSTLVKPPAQRLARRPARPRRHPSPHEAVRWPTASNGEDGGWYETSHDSSQGLLLRGGSPRRVARRRRQLRATPVALFPAHRGAAAPRLAAGAPRLRDASTGPRRRPHGASCRAWAGRREFTIFPGAGIIRKNSG
jgi:hypothetical protein